MYKSTFAALGVVAGGTALFLAHFLNRDYFPPISHHIGDFPVFAYVYGSSLAPDMFQNARGGFSFLKNLGKHIPELTAIAASAYVAVGETIADIIPGNSRDAWDIPAGLVGAAAGYVLARTFRVTSSLDEKVKSNQ